MIVSRAVIRSALCIHSDRMTLEAGFVGVPHLQNLLLLFGNATVSNNALYKKFKLCPERVCNQDRGSLEMVTGKGCISRSLLAKKRAPNMFECLLN